MLTMDGETSLLCAENTLILAYKLIPDVYQLSKHLLRLVQS